LLDVRIERAAGFARGSQRQAIELGWAPAHRC
jgi:hypothetical protein